MVGLGSQRPAMFGNARALAEKRRELAVGGGLTAPEEVAAPCPLPPRRELLNKSGPWYW